MKNIFEGEFWDLMCAYMYVYEHLSIIMPPRYVFLPLVRCTVPDRLTAIDSLRELNPLRRWNLVLVSSMHVLYVNNISPPPPQ